MKMFYFPVQQVGAMESFKDVLTAGLVSIGAIFRGEKFGVSMIESGHKKNLERKDQAVTCDSYSTYFVKP
jgi:hypothetical protein